MSVRMLVCSGKVEMQAWFRFTCVPACVYVCACPHTGNVEVALGRLSDARTHFQAASRDPALRSIALQNMALAAFEGGDNELAIRIARQNLRK